MEMDFFKSHWWNITFVDIYNQHHNQDNVCSEYVPKIYDDKKSIS